MQDRIAALVHPVLSYGLSLIDRLARGEDPDLAVEQAVLKDLLLTEYEAGRWIDFGGEPGHVHSASPSATPEEPPREAGGRFLGVRYALVCWLDEVFTSDPSWGARWNESKLEVELYGTNDRAWRFWEQARLAQARPGIDAIEVFYLCVTLGFRGELRGADDKLRTWVASTRLRLGKLQDYEWPAAAEPDPPPQVPPLIGRDKLRQMAAASWLSLVAIIPLAAFFLVFRLGR